MKLKNSRRLKLYNIRVNQIEKRMLFDCRLKKMPNMVKELYGFFKLGAVKSLYNGTTLKRLIETRWSGNLAAVRVRNALSIIDT